jgi:hypothetical protein
MTCEVSLMAALNLPAWIQIPYSWVIVPYGVYVLMHVMQMAEHDRHLKRDPNTIRWARRVWFIATAMILTASGIWTSIALLFSVVMSGLINLMINEKSLKMRRPPENGSHEYAASGVAHRMVVVPREGAE